MHRQPSKPDGKRARQADHWAHINDSQKQQNKEARQRRRTSYNLRCCSGASSYTRILRYWCLTRKLTPVTEHISPAHFACMRVEYLYATTGFVNRAFPDVGGQWLGKTSPRPTFTHLLAARAPAHEDGGRDHDAPHVLHERSDGGNSGTRTYWR